MRKITKYIVEVIVCYNRIKETKVKRRMSYSLKSVQTYSQTWCGYFRECTLLRLFFGIKISTGIRDAKKKNRERRSWTRRGHWRESEERRRWRRRGGGEGTKKDKEEEERLTGCGRNKLEVNQTYRSYRSSPLPPTELLPVTSLYLASVASFSSFFSFFSFSLILCIVCRIVESPASSAYTTDGGYLLRGHKAILFINSVLAFRLLTQAKNVSRFNCFVLIFSNKVQ